MTKREVTVDLSLVAYCGLYCGACGAYLKGRCPGCHENQKASWCKVRGCCVEHSYRTCADCTTHPDPKTCAHFDSFISKLIGLLLNSNRAACIAKVRELGPEGYAAFMAEARRQTLPRRS